MYVCAEILERSRVCEAEKWHCIENHAFLRVLIIQSNDVSLNP
jgi:hypothetical protein